MLLALGGCGGVGAPPADAVSVERLDQTATLLQVADDTRAHGDPVTAANLYRQLHERQPKDPAPLTRLGATLLQLERYAEAADAYRAALELVPADADAHRGLAAALVALGEPTDAVATLQTALAAHAGDPRLLNALGVAHEMAGRHDLAIADFRRGLERAPGDAGLRNNYGLSLALAGNYAEAIATLAPLANRPDAPQRYRLNLALAYGLAADDDKAAAAARLVLDPAAIANNLAYYKRLRALDEKARTAAIFAAQLRGAALPVPAPVAAAAPSEIAAAPKAAEP